MKTETGDIKVAKADETKLFNPHPALAGNYEYQVCETEHEAAEVLKEREIKVIDLVNAELKNRARANEYQKLLAPFKKSQMTESDRTERLIRDLMILRNIDEKTARELVGAL